MIAQAGSPSIQGLGRRGMLELDLLFEALRSGWPGFDEIEQGHTRLLAGCDDGDLLRWWLGMEQPVDLEVLQAVVWLQQVAPPRPSRGGGAVF